ncbi:polysaccharide lyase family 14 protein, partial [Coprinopsis marcescibilis]
YPKGSINPAQKPQGGIEFYASPLPLSALPSLPMQGDTRESPLGTPATNVTLRYSVFFPKDFDWVLAGKLPGLYGGHTGCSGGNAALDCFSTRLMWRKDGLGELYLYAAKDKQTDALCDAPTSVCDAAYGFSVGRGSFAWSAGAWTTVEQTVVLNTPGKQDGWFSLDVNGKRVIHVGGVFYRDTRPCSFVPLPSTFFGGHDEKYATPRDQYVWFKDFAL